jgi:uncharacterized protein YyaL (SSP411 family)
MHQPVRWQEWGPEAFARAQREDKPVLLDSGAVWCHWCHVMDRESYEDPTLASLINERFVAVKIDRDERPDVDSRYQAAVQAISGQGGWPLTAILTPDGRPFFGGTYFPRHDLYGRPGIERVLLTMAEAWRTRREEVLESADSILAAIEHGEAFAGRSGTLSSGIVDKLVEAAVAQFDPNHGGFGAQPKFPHPAALDLLLDTALRKNDEAAAQAALVTLREMAAGGIYDHIAGGFHRYSVDERWVVPHFEKMLYDNAALLGNYAHALQTLAGSAEAEPFARVVRETIGWMDTWLSDRERGGFYASQDADMTLDDDGDYFTWTRAEAAAVLAPDELEVAGEYWDIGEIGDMHHNPAKNVLHVKGTAAEVARKTGRDEGEVERLLRSAKEKLYAARKERPTPLIDRTLYTGWNAMAVSSYLRAAQVLRLDEAKRFALRTLERVLAEGWPPDAGLRHVVAYPDGAAPGEAVPGMLEDFALLAHACLDAWEATGERRWFEAAERVARTMIERFYDGTGGGFFDAPRPQDAGSALGALATRRKPLQDSPTPAGNPAAAWALLRLHALTDRTEYRELAEDTLEAFAGIVEHFGLYAGTYGLALRYLLEGPVQVVIAGGDEAAERLEAAAMAGYLVNKAVVRLRPEQVDATALPPALAETIPHLPGVREGESCAAVCRGTECLPPVRTAEELRQALTSPRQ